MRTLFRLLVFREPEKPRYAFSAGFEDRPEGKEPGSKAYEKNEKLRTGRRLDAILEQDHPLSADLDANETLLREILRLPANKDVVVRRFTVGTEPPLRALLVFLDGPTDRTVQNLAILQPLMLLPGMRPDPDWEGVNRPSGADDASACQAAVLRRIRETLLPGNEVTTVASFKDVLSEILAGNTVLLLDTVDAALSVETKAWATRGVGPPQVEAVIRGPQEAFTEQIRINITLVRKILRRSSLVADFVKVGQMSAYQCAVLYLDDVVNPDLVAEVRRRLESIKADYVNESGILEQFIEDAPRGLAPQTLATERPDRVAAGLVEGRLAILLDGNPWALVVPATFFSMMHAAEDAYVRWPFGTFARLIRYIGLGLALLLPGSYIALVTYHQEFIPTSLLLAFTGAREQVPFPTVVEVLLMEISFELIREAGIRIPGTVGTTLGIVGALILGQAAVAANIVSPILIVIVALTALGSFAIPNYPFSLSIRTLRFGYIALGSVLGLLGIMAGLFIHLALLVRLTSFGVPFFAPVAPATHTAPDYLWREPAWEQERRPDFVDPLRRRRQPRVSRGWVRAKKRDDKRPGGR